jgi:hypothetical protein
VTNGLNRVVFSNSAVSLAALVRSMDSPSTQHAFGAF